MKKPALGLPEIKVLEYELTLRGIEEGDFARQCGVGADDFANQRCLGFPRLQLRWQIEKALGHISLWSDPVTMALRVRCFKAFGADPFTCSKNEIIPILRRYRISPTGHATLPQLRDDLIAWLAVHPEVSRP